MSVTKVTGMMQTSTVGGDIPSASTLVIDTDGDFFDISGTTGITAMTVDAGRRFTLQFDGAVTLTHGSSLYLPGATNFTTEANDCLSFIATAANTVRCTGYALKDGGSPVAPSGGGTVLIETFTDADLPTMSFTGFNNTLYDSYEIFFTLDPSVSNAYWQCLVSTNGGSSYDTSGIYENTMSKTFTSETESRYFGATGGTSILFSGDMDNTAGVRVGGTFTLISPGDGYHTNIFYNTATYAQGGAGITMLHREGVTRYKSTTAINAFRIQTQSASSDAAMSGRMYGRVK